MSEVFFSFYLNSLLEAFFSMNLNDVYIWRYAAILDVVEFVAFISYWEIESVPLSLIRIILRLFCSLKRETDVLHFMYF